MASTSTLSSTSTVSSPSGSIRPDAVLKWGEHLSSLKPKNKERFYYKLFRHPTNYEATILDLLENFETNHGTHLMQFFLDLAGFLQLDIRDIYDGNTKKLIENIDKSVLKYKKTREKFIFLKPSNVARLTDVLLVHLFEQFLEFFNINETPHDETLIQIFTLISSMTDSNIRSICATGVILSIKLTTALAHRYADLQETHSSTELHKLEQLLKYVYTKFDAHCLTCDTKLAYMRALCAKEIAAWLEQLPDLFATAAFPCVKRLVRLIIDEDHLVRASALGSLKAIVSVRDLTANVDSMKVLQACLGHALGRLQDVNADVYSACVCVFKALADDQPNLLTDEMKRELFQLLFDENLARARGAADFYVAYIRTVNKSGVDLIELLIRMAYNKPEMAEENLSAIVELFHDDFMELSDVEFLFEVLGSELKDSQRGKFLNLMCESLRFLLTGTLHKSRSTTEFELDPSCHIQVARILILNLKDLVLAVNNDKDGVQNLVRIVSFVDFERIGELLEKKQLAFLFNFLNECFQKAKHWTLLHIIVEAIYKISKTGAVEQEIQTVFLSRFVNELNQSMTDLNRIEAKSFKVKATKAAALYEKFNLNLNWTLLQDSWNKDPILFKQFYSCLKSHLIWKLKDPEVHIRDFINQTNIFVNETVCLLNWYVKINRNLNNLIFILQHFCRFFSEAHSISVSLSYRPSMLPFVEFDDEYQELLMYALRKTALVETFLTPEERRRLFHEFFFLLDYGLFDATYIAVILDNYESHYELFGDIYDGHLKEIYSGNKVVIPLCIHHVMYLRYEKMLAADNYSISQSFIAIAQKLTLISMDQSDYVKLFSMGINYGLKIPAKKYAGFFVYLKEYLSLISKDVRQKILSEFGSLLKNRREKHVVKFLQALKNQTA